MFTLREDPLQDRSPLARHLERRRMAAMAAAGAAVGVTLGIVLVVLVDRGRITGSDSNPAVFLGLPVGLAVIGTILGLLLSLAGRSHRDAPVREWRHVVRRRAATDVEGDTRRQGSGRSGRGDAR